MVAVGRTRAGRGVLVGWRSGRRVTVGEGLVGGGTWTSVALVDVGVGWDASVVWSGVGVSLAS